MNKNFAQQNAERRLRHARWEAKRTGATIWYWFWCGIAGLVVSAGIMSLIKMWLD